MRDSAAFTLHTTTTKRYELLPFGRLRYGEPNAVENAIGYAKHRSRSHHAVICVYADSGNVVETHEHKGNLKAW